MTSVYWTDKRNVPRAYACGEDTEERQTRAEARAQVMAQNRRKLRGMHEHVCRTRDTLSTLDAPPKYMSLPGAAGELQRIEEASMQLQRKPKLDVEPDPADPKGGNDAKRKKPQAQGSTGTLEEKGHAHRQGTA